MNRETILEALRNKYADLGLSDAILGAQTDLILNQNPTDETLAGFIDGAGVLLKSFQSDLDKARTKTKSTPKTEEKKSEEKAPENGDDTPAWAKSLISRLDNMEKKDGVKANQTALTEALKAKGVPEAYLSRAINAVVFDDQYDQETTVNAIAGDFNALKEALAVDSVAGNSSPANPTSLKPDAVDADIERLA